MELVVFAGQSNALGFGMSSATLPSHLTIPNPTAYIFGGTYWGQLQPGVNTGTEANPNAWGPEAEFAYRYGLDHPGEVLLIVKSAKGSTGLAQDSALDWSPNSNGELFDFTSARIADAKAALLRDAGLVSPEASGVFWMQGEQDGLTSSAASAYDDNLVDFFSAVRAEWMHDPAGAIVFGRISDSASIPYNSDVRVAQWAVDQADTNASSFKTIGYAMQADGVHYAAAGHVSIGTSFYNGWLTI